MNEFDSCVHRIIKQIYPVLAYEYEMGLSESRGESSGIYSFQFLKSLHENSMDNIHKILRQTEADAMNKKEFDKAEKKILLEFFTYLNEKKSQLTQLWLSLQHYMHFIYRSLTSANPQIYNKEISEYYIAEMKNLVKILSEADEIQLYLRIFSILREYVTFAFWQYSKQTNKGPAIERLYRCYQTFLIASKNIYPVFTDLEKLLKDKCNMTWMDYNKFVFFNYFYDTINSEILIKVKQKEDIDVPEEYNAMIVDFGELNTLWQTLKTLRGINENMDKEMSEDHKQILNKNFWICRNDTEEKHSVQRLAAELIILASERRIRGSEPLLDKNGQCLCEDCLIFKLSYIVESGEAPTYTRLSPCRYCLEAIELNKLHDHVVDHLKSIVSNNSKSRVNTKIEENVAVRRKSLENKNNDSDKKMSQCLINLLKKNKNTVKKTDILKKEHINNGLDEKKIECSDINESKENSRVPSIKNDATHKNSSPCSHSCKHEEELKAELKKLQGVCDHHKDSKRCDCTYCEVFGSTVSNHLHKTNETRNRLRIRLNQRKQKIVSKNLLADKTNKTAPVKSTIQLKADTLTTSAKIEPPVQPEHTLSVKTATVVRSISKPTDSSIQDIKIATEPKIAARINGDTKLNDIHGLVDYIEGNSGSDKVAIAEKKAAKKARQRQKKEEERKLLEERERQKQEEKKREDVKLRLLKQLEQEKDSTNDANKKNLRKQKNKEKGTHNRDISCDESDKKSIEETIPAMVTIKRSIENGDNRPTVTITLRGSTPDQDKLLYTLVNGHNDQRNEKEKNNSTKAKKCKKQTIPPEQKSEHFVKLQVLRKEAGQGTKCKMNNSSDKGVKLSFTVNNGSNNQTNQKKNTCGDTEKLSKKQIKVENKKNEELDLPFLRLPPGITITKVDGPLSSKNYKLTMNGLSNSGNNVPMSKKSGVIVVDTEKLIHTNGGNKDPSISRKSKKKKNKKQQARSDSSAVNPQPSMVTLKNPIFQTLTENVSRESSLPIDIAGASCGQASIFKNENGMVTIRSSRLHHSSNNSIPMHNLLSELKPVMGEDISAPVSSCALSTETNMTSFNAQEILSGLPGIEITKVDKRNPKPDHECKASQIAQVSIIPTNGDKCNIDKDDWLYDNIFTPKDVLEDDLDAEERELEAFKRFCQQSVPPKQKEKVAHLNVKDIVLKKKNDINTV